MKKKPSFFERLTGSFVTEEEYDEEVYDDDQSLTVDSEPHRGLISENNVEEAPLAVDMYQTPDAIVIKANVAGIPLDDIDVRITREMVTLRGSHQNEVAADHGNYYHKELVWGTFSRSLMLPEEVDETEAEAVQDDGILTIVLPKLNKNRETKLQIKKR